VSREPLNGTKTDFTSGTKSIALVAASEWFEQMKTLHASPVNVKLFGAKGDSDAAGTTGSDDTAAIQAAIDYIDTLGGGALYFPEGNYKLTSYLTLCRNIRIIGASRVATTLIQTAAGGGGTTAGESLRNGSVFYSNWPSNASNGVEITVEHIGLSSPDAATSLGAGFYDNGGGLITIQDIRTTNLKFGVVLDQSEVVDIVGCNLAGTTTGGACVWIVNGPDLTPGNMGGFTNRIGVKQTQLNAHIDVTLIRDDGGTSHVFGPGNNYNGGDYCIRMAGVTPFCVLEGEFEGGSINPILLTDTTSEGNGAGGCTGQILGGIYSSTNSPINIVSGGGCVYGCVFASPAYGITGAAGAGRLDVRGCLTTRADRNIVDSSFGGTTSDGLEIPKNNFGLGTFTLFSQYLYNVVQCTNPVSNAATISSDATWPLAIGSWYLLEQTSTGPVSFVADTTVTISGPNSTTAQFQRIKATKIAPNSWQTQLIAQKPLDSACNLSDVGSLNASIRNLQAGYVLGQSAVPVSHTGDTTQFTLAAIPIPASAAGANGRIVVRADLSFSNNANAKTSAIKLGPAQLFAQSFSSTASTSIEVTIDNRNAQNSQRWTWEHVTPAVSGYTNGTSAVDTSAAQSIAITGQLANASDTVTLESYQVTIYPKA
jgi:hypothetical protein